MAIYNASKAFNKVFSQSLMLDYGSSGVDVLTVSPMSVISRMNRGVLLGSITAAEHAEAVLNQLGHG
jgi:short-subunit dehydrogenase